jgi:hypothetical protein
MPEKSWITHAGGAGRLIQLRGPGRHSSGFDYAMFMASRAYVVCFVIPTFHVYSGVQSVSELKQISEAIVTRQRCFLDDDEWRCIRMDSVRFPLMPENCAIYHEALNHFAIIPGLLKSFRHLSTGSVPDGDANLYCKVRELHSNLIEWYQRLHLEVEQPIRKMILMPLTACTMLSSVYEYRDIITGSFVVNYCAYLLQINSVLDVLECSEIRREENIALAKDICMSANYMSKAGFCGRQTMAFALPFAISALPQDYAGWLHSELMACKSVQESGALRSAMLDESRFIQS